MPLPHASRHTVLAVEDDDLIRSLLDDTLCDLGYRTITAANGQEALAALQAHQDIDLLVTDVRMPLLNGVDLVAPRASEKAVLPQPFHEETLPRTSQRRQVRDPTGPLGSAVTPLHLAGL